MYKTSDKSQPSLLDFNQPLGLRMNTDNRWVQLADKVPWNIFEEKYAALFPGGTGFEPFSFLHYSYPNSYNDK